MNAQTHIGWMIFIAVCALPVWAVDEAKPTTAAADSGNALGMDIYGKIRAREGNLCLSPYSIGNALAMVYCGAHGETASQMAKALHLDVDAEETARSFSALRESLLSPDQRENYTLTAVNRLWGRSGVKYLDAYLDLTRRSWGAPLETVDFAADAEAARKKINRWVADETRQKIEELLPPDSIHGDTQLVLTNALYFLSHWAKPFEKDNTARRPFHVAPGQTIQVPTMYQEGHFGLRSRDGMQILHIPYNGYRLWMAIVVPERIDGLVDAERLLRPENLAGWKSTEMRMLQVYLPKFKVSAQFDLTDTLKALGMSLPFQPEADLSGITGRPDLMLSGVFHATLVDTAEQGTEAAAASAAVLMPTAAPPGEMKVVRVDRPFIFFIYDEESGAILFLGRVVDPSITPR